MKKIITLLLGVIAVTSVFAQSQADKQRAKDKVFGGSNYPTTNPNNYPTNYPNTYPSNYPNNSSAQAEIDQINRDYDAKIYSVQNNPYLSPAEKDRQIRQLNQDRQRRIQEVYNRYGNGNGTYGNGKYKRKHKDHDDDDDRYENRNGKGNNGKHLGWEKGRGNPHKGGNWKD